MRRFSCLLPFLIIGLLLLFNPVNGEPRTQTIQLMCSRQREQNTAVFVPNFVAVMENISTQMRTSGFGQSEVGSGPDANLGFAQCYGDLSLVDCALCYAEARTIMPQCYPNNGARIYLDGCFMRVENYTFYQEALGPDDHAVCGNSTRKSSGFAASAREAVRRAAAAAPTTVGRGFARDAVPVAGSNETAYVLANCWRTLSMNSCRTCLENASALVTRCLPWSEGRALNAGCFMRYSDTNFLNPPPSSGSSRGTIIVVVVSVVSILVLLGIGAAVGAYIWKKKQLEKKRRGSDDAEKMVKILHDSSLNFKYSTLEKATGSFAEENKLGQGGYGTVYKGVLSDGREIAVKRLFFNNRHRAADFYNEVNIISSVEHKNLVRLLGCSCSGPESLLVYEYLANQSLDRFLFDPEKGAALKWEKRCEIIVGTVEGLAYLHENPKNKIIHRDIKASNILLDLKLRAKIADFGLARSFQEDQSHISTAIAGTLGYMAPEYLAHGQLTEKADVYSFGVLLLEIVTGKQNNQSNDSEYTDSLVMIAWNHFQSGTVEELYDPNLMETQSNNSRIKMEMSRMVHIGLLCTQESPLLRPSMSKVLHMLKKEEHLPTPTNPPFMDERTMELNDIVEDPSFPLSSTSMADISLSYYNPR